MVREQVQRVVLIVVGLLFLALVIPGVMFFSREPSIPMLMSLYVTLGVFLLLAARNPVANRSLIAFAGWANVAHAAVMALQEYWHVIEPREIVGVVVFGIIGILLIALTPAKEPVKRATMANAA
jgi:succinate-acetate transporter protein